MSKRRMRIVRTKTVRRGGTTYCGHCGLTVDQCSSKGWDCTVDPSPGRGGLHPGHVPMDTEIWWHLDREDVLDGEGNPTEDGPISQMERHLEYVMSHDIYGVDPYERSVLYLRDRFPAYYDIYRATVEGSTSIDEYATNHGLNYDNAQKRRRRAIAKQLQREATLRDGEEKPDAA